MIPYEVSRFRAHYRSTQIADGYSGGLHFGFVTLLGLSVMGWALSRLHDVQPAQWLTVPLTFLIANVVEYFAHRGPMHHATPGLGLIHRRHALGHHRFFTGAAMTLEDPQDIHIVLFPPILILFFTVVALPIGWGLYRAFGPNVGLLFVTVALGYFLTYEWLHYSYHAPPSWPLNHFAPIRRLRAHHTVHHDAPDRNFNITFPICDTLFHTRQDA